MNKLDYFRQKIDRIDQKLLKILAERFRVVKSIGEFKRKMGMTPLDNKRFQKMVQDRIRKGKQLSLPKKFIVDLYELIHQQSLKIEKYSKRGYLTIGIQGGRGSFNEEAINYYLEKSGLKNIKIKYLLTSENVLKALSQGKIDRGQFAVYNIRGGMVKESIAAMAKYKFRIVDEYSIKISHALMIRKDADFSKVTTIMTHPQVLAQCRNTLIDKYPNLKQVSGKGKLVDQATVARYLSENKISKQVAVIGSKILAKVYGLKIIAEGLEDIKENYTTFLQVKL